MMPGLDGPDDVQSGCGAGQLPPDVPIVFLTAKAQGADRERLRRWEPPG